MLRVRRYTRNESVVGDLFAANRVDHAGHPHRYIPARINHRIPLSAVQRGNVVVTIAPQYLDACMDAGIVPSASEGRDLMATRQRGFDETAAEEQCAADDQEPHTGNLSRCLDLG